MRPLSPLIATYDTILASQIAALALPGLISSEEDVLHARLFSCFEEGVEGFYNILGVRWDIIPSLQLTTAFHSE